MSTPQDPGISVAGEAAPLPAAVAVANDRVAVAGGEELPGEGSLISRFVAIITPFFAVAAGWLSGIVANNVPGVHLDKNEIVAFMVAVVTAVLTSSWKWLQGWQQHERTVAEGKATARKQPAATKS